MSITKSICARGEIYWIKANPYKQSVGHVQKADRPGVIVSSEAVNNGGFTYEIVYLTTAPKKDMPTHCTIRSSDRVSTALCEQITTISSEQIGRYIGFCTDQEMDIIDSCLMLSLGLDAPATPNAYTMVDPEWEEEDEYENLVPDAREYIDNLRDEISRLRGKEELLRQMYNELLAQTLTAPK